MYRLFASMVQGPYRQEPRTFSANEIPDELAHAQVTGLVSAGLRMTRRLPLTLTASQNGYRFETGVLYAW
jgi:hypothetical protein